MTELAPAPGMARAAEKLGGELRAAGETHYILVDLGLGEKASVIPSPCGAAWIVYWPWGDPERCHFPCENLKAVEDTLADLCTTPRPFFHKGD